MSANRLFRTGALLVASQAMVALLGILALRFYTGLVTATVFGETSLVLSALALGLQLFVAGFVAAHLRFYTEAEARGDADEFTRETMTWSLRATGALIGLSVVILAALRLTGVFRYPASSLLIGAIWLFGMTVRNVFMSRIQAQRRQAKYALLQVIEASLLFGVTMTALHFAASVRSFLSAQVGAIALFLLVVLVAEPRTGALFRRRTRCGAGFGAKAWSYGAPFAPMSFLSWLANLGDRYTLGILLGPQAAGRYVASFSIPSRGMMLANSALCDLFRPILFNAENSRDDKGAHHAFLGWIASSITLSSVGLAVIYFAGPLIVRWLLAPGYRSGAVPIMLWVSLGYAVSGLTQIIECRLLSLGHSARLLLPMILGAAANVGFSIVMIRNNGIVGAAQATCASFVFQNLATVGFLLHALSRRTPDEAEERKIAPA